MRGYNTAESADDIDALRRHLGVETVDLWGISYGTHLALSVLKRHPDQVGRVVLASLEGQDQTVKRPARLDAYLQRVDALLDADPAVRAALPDLPALMRRVHDRLEAAPIAVTMPGAAGPKDLQVGGFAVQLIAGALIANPGTLVLLPRLYLELDGGETAELAPFVSSLAGGLGVTGMPEAMDLASGISTARLSLVEAEARTAVLGDALNFPMPHLLGAVEGVDLGDDFRVPLRITTPALLVAGTLDGRTPLEEQAEVAAQFRNRTQVTVDNAGHNVFESHPDVQDLIVRFFRRETVEDTRLSLPPPSFRIA
jgi:pimeloyl-ACP methyl ester carboxylesterase